MATTILRSAFTRAATLGLFVAVLGFSPHPGESQADPIVIKLASMAPANTDWHFALQEMGDRWKEASGGLVELQITSSAQGGEESDVLRRMVMGMFQAGTFPLAGLQNLTPSVVVLALPLAMETQDDLHRVRAALGPKLEKVFEEKGFVLLHWVDMGWLQFFTPDSDPTPDAVRSYRYPEWGENALSEVWRAAGFAPGVRLNMADVTVGLQTGMIEAINTAPLVVFGYQWFIKLKYMIDLHWAPLSGATLIDKESWERIPESLRPELLAIARETGEELADPLVQWERNAIADMEAEGLKVITPPPEVLREWQRIFEEARGLLRGGIVPEDWFDLAMEIARSGRGS